MAKRYWLWLAGVLMITLLAACGGGGNAPAATAAPVNQNYQGSTTGGNIAFNYPVSWATTSLNGQIAVANSQTALNAPTPSSGQFRFQMLVGPISVFDGLTAQSTPRDVLQYLLPKIGAQGVQYSSPVDMTVGTYSASSVQASANDGQASIVAVNMGNGIYNIVSAVSASGELAQFQPTLNAILATVTYNVPAPSQQNAPAATSEAQG